MHFADHSRWSTPSQHGADRMSIGEVDLRARAMVPQQALRSGPERSLGVYPNSAPESVCYAVLYGCGSTPAWRPTVESRQLIAGAAYGPEALKVIGQAFDEAWRDTAGN